jgi:hypothetical protein
VVPLASEHAARYYDLVARQRTAVCEASGGRLDTAVRLALQALEQRTPAAPPAV